MPSLVSMDHDTHRPNPPSPEQIKEWERIKFVVSEVWSEPGLYIGGYPTKRVIRQLEEYRVSFIVSVSLRRPPEIIGIPVVRYPFVDQHGTLPDVNLLREAAWTASAAMFHGERVFIHCAYGLNRSSLVAAEAMKMYTGLQYRGGTILEELDKARPGVLHNPAFRDYVRDL